MYNDKRKKHISEISKMFGAFKSICSNDEIEAAEIAELSKQATEEDTTTAHSSSN